MEKFNNIEEKLVRYFSKTASADEVREIGTWREMSSANEKLYQEYENTWMAWNNYSEMLAVDTQKASKKIEKKLGTSNSPTRIWMAYAMVAYILLPLAVLSFAYYFFNFSQTESGIPMQKIITAYGTRKQIVLPDSSVVWLNAGSSLEFPLAFSSDRREVVLNGEAYFDVVRNPKQPFYVKLDKMAVKALGTEFNVRAYPGDDRIETTLLSGLVHLVQEKASGEKTLLEMEPDQHAVYNKLENHILVSEKMGETSTSEEKKKDAIIAAKLPTLDAEVVSNKHTAWVAGKLIFRNDSMEEIVRRLERWYNVEIILENAILKDYSYTATFTDETLEQVLELLKMSAPIDYKIKGREKLDETTFTKKEVIIDVKK